MIGNATPRHTAGTRQQAPPDYKRLIGQIAPRWEQAAEYVVLAALLHHPELAAPFAARLHPGDWMTDLHRTMARIALSHLRALGRVDMRQLCGVIVDAAPYSHHALALELRTLASVADLICGQRIVAEAVTALRGGDHDRKGVAA